MYYKLLCLSWCVKNREYCIVPPVFYCHDRFSCLLLFAQSRRYRLISVWYGMPALCDCALKKSIVFPSMFIVICRFSCFAYGFFLGFRFLMSYSCFMFLTSTIYLCIFSFRFWLLFVLKWFWSCFLCLCNNGLRCIFFLSVPQITCTI